MDYDQTGLLFTEHAEGCKLTAYQDQKGVWTIGTGHTGEDVYEGLTITQEQADAFLHSDIQTAVAGVNAALAGVSLTQDEFDACVDLTFKIGVHAFTESTVARCLNAGDFDGAAQAFFLWDKCGGQYNQGLFNRRTAEVGLFKEAEGQKETDA